MSKKYELPEIVNRKAKFNYEFLETYKAGMVLTGTEIKSVKEAKVNIGDSFCYFRQGELWLKNLHISEYKNGSYANHEPLRLRKLLLTKKEIKKLEGKIKEKGLTIIPFKLFFNERGLAKIEIALARGKKSFDKRESIKERDTKKEIQRVQKSMR
ncbi:MAG TPA: SsrA-binding protein SmpB [Chitinophagales bacterium]|nr:SsrA-binding protein SmpB [Chitinophagales bacterium]HMW12635.1 SsrA-binding protein SmpB [Chitinophagales bacterium]HMX59103.1 SsrA-binding protein SmpB [Chitinophagales bacterium]HMY22753.1 SsrA-binding protein SmpB [Chitinophagales bacterium]HMZ33292.1 SsrA-binding protein SmpB [Chitinophagales bacterium]